MTVQSISSHPKEPYTKKECTDSLNLSITKSDISTGSKNLINKNNAHSEGVGVERFNPDSNEIVLKNGRTIQY